MSVDQWQAIGVVSGALVALLTLIGIVWRKGIRPVWKAAWRTIRRLDQVADDLLGDEAKGVPSMVTRFRLLDSQVRELDRKLNEHITQHDGGVRANSGRPPQPPPRRAGGAR